MEGKDITITTLKILFKRTIKKNTCTQTHGIIEEYYNS
jgi:hypothetical protein